MSLIRNIGKQIRYFLFVIFRYPLLKARGNKLGKHIFIGSHSILNHSNIGNYVYIGNGSVINDCDVGNYTQIAPYVQIGGMIHSYWWLSISTHLSDKCISGKKTIIGPDVWIAAGCIIGQGVTIDQGAVIGANSFVTKDIPPYAIVYGSPAKIQRFRFDEAIRDKLIDSKYFVNSPEQARRILQKISVD